MYSDGNAVQVDGLPNAGNFSSPELTATPTGYRVYFSTAANSGALVVVTNLPDAPTAPVPALSPSSLMSLAALLTLAGVAASRLRS